jgi:uncharacterized pyridoxamine 5'-phosphate oxidase family protein
MFLNNVQSVILQTQIAAQTKVMPHGVKLTKGIRIFVGNNTNKGK